MAIIVINKVLVVQSTIYICIILINNYIAISHTMLNPILHFGFICLINLSSYNYIQSLNICARRSKIATTFKLVIYISNLSGVKTIKYPFGFFLVGISSAI